MNTCCPQCDTDLRLRYMGPLRPRCPECKSILQHNAHPSEARKLTPEFPILLGAAAAASIGYALKASIGLVSILGWVGALAGVAWYFSSGRSNAPVDWPRWVVANERSDGESRQQEPP